MITQESCEIRGIIIRMNRKRIKKMYNFVFYIKQNPVIFDEGNIFTIIKTGSCLSGILTFVSSSTVRHPKNRFAHLVGKLFLMADDNCILSINPKL